jgi:glycerol-3-phosphate dehydrogenase
MLGGLKNIVSMLAGFAEGLDAGFNTRAAVVFYFMNNSNNIFYFI